MVKKENLIELMHQKYQSMIPKAIYQQREKDFKKIRETNLQEFMTSKLTTICL